MNDFLSRFLCTNNILKQQGWYCDTKLHQYNKSEILSETNEIQSSSKRTQHINIRLHFINYHIILKELNVKQFYTDDMLADFPSKHLKVINFNIFKNKIMGINK